MIRIFRKTCQVCGEKTRNYKKCPLCGRYTCVPDIMEMQMVGMGNKCVFCNTDLIASHVIIHASKDHPSQLKKTRRYPLITTSVSDFEKMASYPQGPLQVKYNWDGVIDLLCNTPMTVKFLYDFYDWGDSKPTHGLVWRYLKKAVHEGRLSKKVAKDGSVFYGPPAVRGVELSSRRSKKPL